MALKTLGSNLTTSLSALVWANGLAGTNATDFASLAQLIKDDQNVTLPVIPSAFTGNGTLLIPNRGLIKLLPGDYVGVDSTGWPIVLSAKAIASGPWTHS